MTAILVTHQVVYETTDLSFRKEYLEWLGDYPHTPKRLREFVKDRFINPNFDTNGSTNIVIMGDDKTL